jgi:hypothetical protein
LALKLSEPMMVAVVVAEKAAVVERQEPSKPANGIIERARLERRSMNGLMHRRKHRHEGEAVGYGREQRDGQGRPPLQTQAVEPAARAHRGQVDRQASEPFGIRTLLQHPQLFCEKR